MCGGQISCCQCYENKGDSASTFMPGRDGRLCSRDPGSKMHFTPRRSLMTRIESQTVPAATLTLAFVVLCALPILGLIVGESFRHCPPQQAESPGDVARTSATSVRISSNLFLTSLPVPAAPLCLPARFRMSRSGCRTVALERQKFLPHRPASARTFRLRQPGLLRWY